MSVKGNIFFFFNNEVKCGRMGEKRIEIGKIEGVFYEIN